MDYTKIEDSLMGAVMFCPQEIYASIKDRITEDDFWNPDFKKWLRIVQISRQSNQRFDQVGPVLYKKIGGWAKIAVLAGLSEPYQDSAEKIMALAHSLREKKTGDHSIG